VPFFLLEYSVIKHEKTRPVLATGVATAMAVFHKIVKLVKNGVLMIIHIYTKVSYYLNNQ
jgi:hypothetical protein